MGVTRLKRKARRNKQTAAKRQNSIKHLSFQPVIKNVDQEELKASFEKAEAPAAKKSKKKSEKPAEEKEKEVVAEAPAKEEAPAEKEEKTEE